MRNITHQISLVSVLCLTTGLACAETAIGGLPTDATSMRVFSQDVVVVLVAQAEEQSGTAEIEKNSDPAPSEDVQERSVVRPPMPGGLRPGGPMKTPPPKAIPFTCSDYHCYCFGEVDCYNLAQSGVCVSWVDAGHCLTKQ